MNEFHDGLNCLLSFNRLLKFLAVQPILLVRQSAPASFHSHQRKPCLLVLGSLS
jgi:hypothetical protein